MEEKENVGSRGAQASKWSKIHPEGRGNEKGFEQGPAMIQFERSFWKHHGDWVSQEAEGRNLSSGFFSLLLLYTRERLIFRL